jgi:hypothetical protein
MKKICVNPYKGVAALMLVAAVNQNALALEPMTIGDVAVGTITGYARIGATWNLQNHPEPDFANPGRTIEGRGELSMLRETLQLQYVNDNLFSFLPKGSKATVIGRLFKESRTTYLKRLDASPFQTGNLMDNYNTNSEAIREAFLDIPFSKRVSLRFGKQQVVWGETDLLQAMDIINPRDLSWNAPGLEPEDEDLRQTLIMANMNVSIPEWGGALQLLYRPGWDRETQLATKLDLFGGRFAAQPTKGFSLAAGGLGYNYHHPHGDTDDPSYGFRWTGTMGESNVGYSLAYYHSVENIPVLNVSVPGVVTPFKGAIGVPGGVGAELILPEFDLIGATLNAYIQPLDLVFRTEASFTKDKVYNGESALGGAALPTLLEKNTVKFMLGFDKQLALMNVLGTDSASFWTVQIFDSWIPGFNVSDKLLDGPGATAHLKEHSVTLVSSFSLSYKNNQVQPAVSVVASTSYGSGAVIPSVNLLYGDHWRLLLNGVFFFPGMLGGCSTQPDGTGANCTHGFAAFDNNNQLGARLTYQF